MSEERLGSPTSFTKKIEGMGYTLDGKEDKKNFKASIEAKQALEQKLIPSIAEWGSDFYNNKKFLEASGVFYQVYRSQQMVDWPDTSYLYNAALSALNAVSNLEKDANQAEKESTLRQAIQYYEELRDLGYTGIKTTYHAIVKASGKKEDFSDKNSRDFSVKIGTHEKPTSTTTPSVRDSYIKNLIYLYEQAEDAEAALELLSQERRRNPSDSDILLRQASLYHKLDRIEDFVSSLKAVLSESGIDEKTKALAYFNLGVVYAREMEDKEESKRYYKKAIEVDPLYKDAYINLAVLILSEEKELNDQLTSLGMSRSDKRKAKKIEKKKQQVYKESLKYLEEARKLTKDENLDVLKTLKNIYYQLDMDVKLSEISKVLKSKQ